VLAHYHITWIIIIIIIIIIIKFVICLLLSWPNVLPPLPSFWTWQKWPLRNHDISCIDTRQLVQSKITCTSQFHLLHHTMNALHCKTWRNLQSTFLSKTGWILPMLLYCSVPKATKISFFSHNFRKSALWNELGQFRCHSQVLHLIDLKWMHNCILSSVQQHQKLV